ncbi:MAG: STAS domain-containing protein [Vulcanimicrobiaceae bacterium]
MLLISISGEWDARKRDELADRLKDAYGATSVVLDLGSSGYITRTFLGVPIHLHRQRMQRRYPPVVLVAGSPWSGKCSEQNSRAHARVRNARNRGCCCAKRRAGLQSLLNVQDKTKP